MHQPPETYGLARSLAGLQWWRFSHIFDVKCSVLMRAKQSSSFIVQDSRYWHCGKRFTGSAGWRCHNLLWLVVQKAIRNAWFGWLSVRISIRIRRSLEWFTVHHLLHGSSLSIVILEGVAVVAPQQSKTLLSSRDSSGLTRW